MSAVNIFIAKTIKGFLIVFGLAMCPTLPFAIDINLITPMFGGLLDYMPSNVLSLRHSGIMIFGIGVLMMAALRGHTRPWPVFEAVGSSVGGTPLPSTPRRRRARVRLRAEGRMLS